jgi:general secretion pathway protein D
LRTSVLSGANYALTPVSEAAVTNSGYSGYPAAARPSTRSIPAATYARSRLPQEAPATGDATVAALEQASGQAGVGMPALDEPGMADELISVNFDQVDIRTVLKTIGDVTGINFVVDDNVSGTVTVMSPTKIRLGDLYQVLESILDVQGCAAVPGAGGLVKIVPKAEAARRNLQVRIGAEPSQIPKTDSVVTQIIPLRYADVTDVSQIIQPLLATGAQMATYPRTNSIVITDTSSNIHHVAQIIRNLDVAGSKEEVTVFSLKYASAQVLSEQISRIMQKSRAASAPASRLRNGSQTDTDMRILPDSRTNSVIVVANPQDTEVIGTLVEQLDVEKPVGTGNVHVVYLKNAQSKEVAQSLTAALTNLRLSGAIDGSQPVQVTSDEGTNSVIITASPQDYKIVSEIIEKLDIVREQVLVEMLIMEISQDELTEIGVDWSTLDQAVDDSVRFFGMTNFGPRVDFASGDLEGLAVGAWKGAGDNLRIGTVLHALQKQSDVNILSTPHILTSNHHKAKIIVGENRPRVMQSRVTETTDFITPTVIKSYEYKDVGISLEITPHISQGGLIRLEISSEFTKLIEDVTATSVDTPTTAKRQAETVVSMSSGSTVVIGGLIRDDKVSIEKKIPILGDLPLIGGLFKLDRDRLQKTNLLIFITPHVVADQEGLEEMTERKREQMQPAMEDSEPGDGSE